jgi:hypothetical protein
MHIYKSHNYADVPNREYVPEVFLKNNYKFNNL